MINKGVVLDMMKRQWKEQLLEHFVGDLDKLRNADMSKVAEGTVRHPVTRTMLKMIGIKAQDLEKVFEEVRQEVLEGGNCYDNPKGL